MLEIKGKVKKIERVKAKCPKDGVHRMNGNGKIVSPKLYKIGNITVPCGNEGFYYKTDENIGIKVYYSFKLNRAMEKEKIMEVCCKLIQYRSICIMPYGVVSLKLNIIYDGKKIKEECYGIMGQYVHTPQKAWTRFLKGYPYSWDTDGDNTIEGYKKFVEYGKAVFGEEYELHKKSLFLGNTAYCTKKNRWYVMDIDWHSIKKEYNFGD